MDWATSTSATANVSAKHNSSTVLGSYTRLHARKLLFMLNRRNPYKYTNTQPGRGVSWLQCIIEGNIRIRGFGVRILEFRTWVLRFRVLLGFSLTDPTAASYADQGRKSSPGISHPALTKWDSTYAFWSHIQIQIQTTHNRTWGSRWLCLY